MLGFLLLILFGMASSTQFENQSSSLSTVHKVIKKDKNNQSVFSYMDIFEDYYYKVKTQLNEKKIDVSFTLDEFMDGYYSHSFSIEEYSSNVVDYATNNYDIINFNNKISKQRSSASSEDAYYILENKYDNNFTLSTEFKKAPKYGKNYFSLLKEGDIIYETNTIMNVGHTAIISNLCHYSSFGNYIQTIEAVGSGVSYGFLDDNRMIDFGVKILRPVCTSINRNRAVEFCKGQIGKPYSLNILRLNKNYNSKERYCSELCYASYNYSRVDIGVRYGESSTPIYLTLGCLPKDIYASYNVYNKDLSKDNKGVDLQIYNFGNNVYQARVFNFTNTRKTIEYNEKMCFTNDAANWSGLKDIRKKDINIDGYVPIIIATNWFATTIVLSYKENLKRIIIYADGIYSNDYKASRLHYTSKYV